MAKDIGGQKFGRLTAIKLDFIKNGRYYWQFTCDCGNKHTAVKYSVTHGKTKSCGCFNRDALSINKRTHGFCGNRFYQIWRGVKQRTQDKKNKGYGGRGISNFWGSFREFKKDMYYSYKKHISKFGESNTTIERIDNNGGYQKTNCRWATYKEQGRNKTNNHFLSFGGDSKPMSEWAEELGINYWTLKTRIRRGWSPEKALTKVI